MQGVGNLVPPHSGTEVCVKKLVPHTGKAVVGFWPSVVQGCAHPFVINTFNTMKRDMILPTCSMTVKVFHSVVGKGRFFQENVNLDELKKQIDRGNKFYPAGCHRNYTRHSIFSVRYSIFKTKSAPHAQF